MDDFKPGDRIHFVGIGGISMSALAEFLHGKGYHVTGTDRQSSKFTAHLKKLGVKIQIGHTSEAIGDADGVVYSAAISSDNPELLAARRQGIPLVKRAKLLGWLASGNHVVGVTGTHGKTTTTAMVGEILKAAGLDPTVLVGGVVRGMEQNLLVGKGKVWAVEADEYDRSFLELNPSLAVVTSLDADHLDCYGDLNAICNAFEKFLSLVPPGGQAVLCGDAPRVRNLMFRKDIERIYYGLGQNVRIRADRLKREGFGSQFRVFDGARLLGDLRLKVPGQHNVYNALAAVGVGIAMGLSFESQISGLEAFRGVHRRFEVLGEVCGITVVNDYAHHPTEIQATLEASRSVWDGRIVVIFQPHLYSRTRDFATEFGKALSQADRVWVTDVYSAREDPIPGISGAIVASCTKDAGNEETWYISDFKKLIATVVRDLKTGDLVVVMGAGDVELAAYEIYEKLRNKGSFH